MGSSQIVQMFLNVPVVRNIRFGHGVLQVVVSYIYKYVKYIYIEQCSNVPVISLCTPAKKDECIKLYSNHLQSVDFYDWIGSALPCVWRCCTS